VGARTRNDHGEGEEISGGDPRISTSADDLLRDDENGILYRDLIGSLRAVAGIGE